MLSEVAVAVGLLTGWCNALERYQVKTPNDPRVEGSFLCPACALQHGRVCDVVYPMTYMWVKTGDTKYLECAKRAVKWSRYNLADMDGARLHNDFAGQWWGITVFSQCAVGKTLLHFGDKLPREVRDDWRDWFEKQSRFIIAKLDLPETFNVNYNAALTEAGALSWKITGNTNHLEVARRWAKTISGCFMADGMLAGEKHPPTFKSMRGFRAVDIGYNMEESIPALYHYAELTGDEEFAKKLDRVAEAHLAFVLPDGGIDNSAGARACKWTHYGSRTSDGAMPMFGAMMKRGIAGAREAAKRHLEMLEQCTSKQSGLLTGGLYYDEADEGACVHHTFAHAKALVDFVMERGEDRGTDIPLQWEGIKEFPSFGATLAKVGPWRATFSVNDVHHVGDDRTMCGGGSMTLLWHSTFGLLAAGTMHEYALLEPQNMQEQRRDRVTRAMTPRIVGDGWSSDIDRDAIAKSEMKEGAFRYEVNGLRYFMGCEITKKNVTIEGDAQGKWSYHLPIVSTEEDEVVVVDDKVTIRKVNGTVKMITNGKIALEKTMRGERAFTPIAGLMTAYFKIEPPKEGKLKIVISEGDKPVIAYEPTLIDRTWLWGHETGQVDGGARAKLWKIDEAKEYFHMKDGAKSMGIENLNVIRWDMPGKEFRDTLKGLKRATWPMSADKYEAHTTYAELGDYSFNCAEEMENVTGFDLDDFFRPREKNAVEIQTPTGTRWSCPTRFSYAELLDLKRRMMKFKRPLELRLVVYDELFDQRKPEELQSAIEVADAVTYWTWKGKNIPKLREYFGKFRKIAPNKPVYLGVYLWDFGDTREMKVELIAAQLKTGLEMFKRGEIAGFVFLCSSICNREYPAVKYARKWLKENAKVQFGEARGER